MQVVEADYEELPAKLRDRRHRRDHGRLRARPVDQGRGLVEWLSRLRPLHDRARRHGCASSGPPTDLAGKRIAIYDDPAAERWVQQNIPNAKISKFSGDDGWFEAVEKDQADALIYDYPFAAEEIKEHPRTVIVQYNLNQSKYAVGVPEGQLRPGVRGQRAIDQFRATPQYADLMREYLSSSSEVFMKPVAGRKTYTVQGRRHAEQDRRQRTEGPEPLEGDLGPQPRPRREREPDLSAARAADALSGPGHGLVSASSQDRAHDVASHTSAPRGG